LLTAWSYPLTPIYSAFAEILGYSGARVSRTFAESKSLCAAVAEIEGANCSARPIASWSVNGSGSVPVALVGISATAQSVAAATTQQQSRSMFPMITTTKTYA
jgi:hypothetical protein